MPLLHSFTRTYVLSASLWLGREEARGDFRKNNIELIWGTIRFIEKDELSAFRAIGIATTERCLPADSSQNPFDQQSRKR